MFIKFFITLISKILSILTALSMLLPSFSGPPANKEEDIPPEDIVLSEYSIIYSEDCSDNTRAQALSLQKAIMDYMGFAISYMSDTAKETKKEILIGKTSRSESEKALGKLSDTQGEDAYVIDISQNKISIVGSTDEATARAVKIFRDEYVKVSEKNGFLDTSAGLTKTESYNSDMVEILSNGLEIERLFDPVTIVQEGGTWNLGGTQMKVTNLGYPKGITLQHQKNPADNGKIISHLAVVDKLGPKTRSCVVESSDGGKTWKIISRPTEQNAMNKAQGLTPGHMSQIYELPEQVGDYPAGTLVYANGSLSYGLRTEIWMWYSTDCGRTWKQTAQIATMPNTDSEGKGVWEPYAIYDNGYLYCFYSDQTNPTYDQALTFRRSKDGVNWEEPKYVCAFEGEREGPGMIIITKMGNGEFFAVYEYYGKAGSHAKGQVYYKKTTDLNDWGDPADLGTMIKSGELEIIGAPACVWVPAGGECGTLIVSGKEDNSKTEEHRIMVSSDYGKTWVTMANPLPYDRGVHERSGKSPTFFAALDGRTVYYINQTANAGVGRRLEFIAFKVY